MSKSSSVTFCAQLSRCIPYYLASVLEWILCSGLRGTGPFRRTPDTLQRRHCLFCPEGGDRVCCQLLFVLSQWGGGATATYTSTTTATASAASTVLGRGLPQLHFPRLTAGGSSSNRQSELWASGGEESTVVRQRQAPVAVGQKDGAGATWRPLAVPTTQHNIVTEAQHRSTLVLRQSSAQQARN